MRRGGLVIGVPNGKTKEDDYIARRDHPIVP